MSGVFLYYVKNQNVLSFATDLLLRIPQRGHDVTDCPNIGELVPWSRHNAKRINLGPEIIESKPIYFAKFSIRATKLNAVLTNANANNAKHPSLSRFHRDLSGSILSQKKAGKKKQMMGAAEEPMIPRMKSSGGLIQVINQVNRSITITVEV